MASEDEYKNPGTAKPARIRKAACGIRFDEDELQEGIDFSGAEKLKPSDPQTESTSSEKHRQTNRHP
ncbi:MAG: hypothetical protein R3193_14435 [Marinobacter sp.]|nr:hypothetical protein [Marinobacter sp.]